ncbi:hypothetical protein Tsubulata_045464 [Turnera subulata]|uniref:Fatty acid hydroxylase domain-containing protein n=1 Tax=Turnera subulata TaxID=218843 RepID=A0A9Q0F6U6_9ROSI|nr:hypothetical protein Tsubulata_045464 [Turnera subulata]
MISFESVQQAALALGRDLTFLEKLWFNYSANIPDYILNCHHVLFLILVYSIVPLPYMFVELWGSKEMEKYKLHPGTKRTFWDMLKCYKNVIVTFVQVAIPLLVFSSPAIKWLGIRTSLPLPSGREIFLHLLVYFLIEDYSHYWLHRFLHTKWGYQYIHHVHHEYSAPIGFAAPYAHWGEALIQGIPPFLGPALVPGHMVTYWLWYAIRVIEAIETHSGYEFPWSPSKFIPFYGGAAYHDYHHSVGGQCHNNFASVFTYCDYIYGTDKGYRCRKSILNKVDGQLHINIGNQTIKSE